ncbi:MAG: 4Fe-4S dicluster domain-containing protein, partial [Lysobacter sp.]
GTHQAMRSGMLAAEHLAASELAPEGFDAKLRASETMAELKKVRNIKPGFKRGMFFGMLNAAWETATFGLSPWTLKSKADWPTLQKLSEAERPKRDYVDRSLAPRDRLAGVYFAATEHDEDQPIHLKVADTNICITQCAEEYGNPCTRFCPAGVYEIVESASDDGSVAKRLQINSANCVHCKTCDIKDPYEIINWVTPEGGSGPNYQNL